MKHFLGKTAKNYDQKKEKYQKLFHNYFLMIKDHLSKASSLSYFFAQQLQLFHQLINLFLLIIDFFVLVANHFLLLLYRFYKWNYKLRVIKTISFFAVFWRNHAIKLVVAFLCSFFNFLCNKPIVANFF